MDFKDQWIDKRDGVDRVSAEHINQVAHGVIENEKSLKKTYTKEEANNIFCNALKGIASGEVVALNDVSPIEHEMGVTVKSKNIFPYFNAITSVTRNGVTITNNGDGSFTINGTVTGSTSVVLYDTPTSLPSGLKAGKTYRLSIPFENHNNTTRDLTAYGQWYVEGSDSLVISFGWANDGSNPQVTDIVPNNAIGFRLYFNISVGVTFDNMIIKPQIEEGTTATAYAPYIEDISAATVSAIGKNLFTFDNATLAKNNADYVSCETGEGWMKQTFSKDVTGNSYQIVSFKFYPPKEMLNKPLIFSADFESDIEKYGYIAIRRSKTGSVINIWGTAPKKDKITKTIQIDGDEGEQYQINFNLSGKADVQITQGQYYKCFNVQIEPATASNSAATAYEPYREPVTYPVSADGTVQGVTPIYPNTTLLTDTAGAVIDCSYNRDINKAFLELQQAILTLGV